jgi:phosphomevalonate kinase
LFHDNGKMAESGKSLRNATLIGISGKQYAGKDFLTDLLLKHLPGFTKVPLALAIKRAYAEQHNLTLEEIERHKAQHRPGLIALGDWGRKQSPDYWLKQALAYPGKKIISDVRLQHEYDFLHEHGAFLIRLDADRAVRAQRGAIVNENDPTETQLDDVRDWDAILTNNGSPKDLEHQLAEYL